MHVKVKLFATLARFSPGGLPGTPFMVEMPEGATLDDLANRLCLPIGDVQISFVNAVIQELDYEIHDGDEIGFFPPIGGGSHD